MNSVQIKIRLDQINSFPSQEGLSINGICSFKFYDNKENKVRPISFLAYGNTAESLLEAGLSSVHIVSGRLNIHKTDKSPNPQPVLTIERTILIKQEASAKASGKTVAQIPSQKVKAQSVPVAPVVDIDFEDINLDDVPF